MTPALRWAAMRAILNLHKTVSTNHSPFEEKGEPKRYRTEVLLLTNLTPYCEAKAAHNRTVSLFVDFNVPSNAQSHVRATLRTDTRIAKWTRELRDGLGQMRYICSVVCIACWTRSDGRLWNSARRTHA